MIENLKVGDLVLTKDNGFQAIVWVGRREVQFSSLQDQVRLRPIQISQRLLASTEPLTVSPHHRILATGPGISLLCGTDEVVMSAEHLAKCGAAERYFDVSMVRYFHIMFKNHELVLSNGTWTESLDPHFLFNALFA